MRVTAFQARGEMARCWCGGREVPDGATEARGSRTPLDRVPTRARDGEQRCVERERVRLDALAMVGYPLVSRDTALDDATGEQGAFG